MIGCLRGCAHLIAWAFLVAAVVYLAVLILALGMPR